jgi:hypothetical protein
LLAANSPSAYVEVVRGPSTLVAVVTASLGETADSAVTASLSATASPAPPRFPPSGAGHRGLGSNDIARPCYRGLFLVSVWFLAVRRRQRSAARNLAPKRAVDVLAKQLGQLAHAVRRRLLPHVMAVAVAAVRTLLAIAESAAA